jgi:cobalt-zinc-cadmium efflux system membrane fusion protein
MWMVAGALAPLPPRRRFCLRLVAVLSGVLGLSFSLTACSDADADARREFPPPYTLDPDDPSVLVVREDLVARLTSEPASLSSEGASVSGFGRLDFAPDAAYAVRVPFDSQVERVLVSVGDAVSAGQPLAELRSSEVAQLRAQVRKATITVQIQSQLVERLRPLVADGTASARELAEAMAAVDAARAELNGARDALAAGGATTGRGDRFTLRASAPGRVIKRSVSPGERVSRESEEPQFAIGDPERIVVKASFPERDAIWLREGARCTFTVHAIGQDVFEGTLIQVVRAVDPQTRASRVVCQPDGQDPRFSAGMVARVWAEARSEERVLVPRSALLLRRDDWVVFVRAGDGRLVRRAVEPGLALGDRVQIVRGVEAGEDVITSGAVLLDGQLDALL